MSRFCAVGFALASLFCGLCCFWGCSDAEKTAGNSAETGSPELAFVEGNLFLNGGEPAAFARVHVIPSSFDVLYDTVALAMETEADEDGSFLLKDLPAGSYSLEAAHLESGELLLVQKIAVPDTGKFVLNDTLQGAGFALLNVEGLSDGFKGVASVLGTTILRKVEVDQGAVLVDSLPADELNLILHMDDGNDVLFDRVNVKASDTLKVGFEEVVPGDSLQDTLLMRFVAPLELPAEADSVGFVSDFPLALRLMAEDCDFEQLLMAGRWEAQRVKQNGARSKKLPIALGYFDSLAQEAVFWVNVDSLNFDDSLELTFDSSLNSGFAHDVFPTNRAYTAVWHFDDGMTLVSDAAEKKNFAGTASGVNFVEGVVGKAAAVSGNGYVVAKNSALADSALHGDFVFEEESFSFSLWVRLDSLEKEQVIFEKNGEYDLIFKPDSGFVVEFYSAGSKFSWSSGKKLVSQGVWTYLAFSKHVFDSEARGMSAFFVNGVVKSDFVIEKWGEPFEKSDFRVGGFYGAFDELMIGNAYRDDSWTYLTYLNQRPNDCWPCFKPVL